jgi:bifunctional isochorismate lyase/aryl carrier protein
MTRGLPTIAAYDLPAASALPPNAVTWRVDPARAALLVHDMQRYFVAAFAPDASPIAEVIGHINLLRRACDARRMPVFYTAQPGRQPRSERGLQADFWGPGMTSAPDHQRIVEALAPAEGHVVLVKHRYSAFQRTDLEARLRALGRDQLIVTGIYASIGCLLTAADAFMRDIQPFLVADAVADFSRGRHEQALAFGAERFAAVTTTAAIIAGL